MLPPNFKPAGFPVRPHRCEFLLFVNYGDHFPQQRTNLYASFRIRLADTWHSELRVAFSMSPRLGRWRWWFYLCRLLRLPHAYGVISRKIFLSY